MGARAVKERVIKGPDCLAEGAEWLAENDPRFARALEQVGPLPLRLRPDGFGALLDAIVSQQISTAAAASIADRMKQAGLTGPRMIMSAHDEDLRAVGLSAPKIRYIRALVKAKINYRALRAMPSADVIKILVTVPGIGPWTAEIYAMFSLGRADVFAPGDLALQEAARDLFDLPDRPNERAFRKMAERWSPWRSVAARALWAYYRVIKNREGIR